MTEPHHAHLAEMRASRPDASAADVGRDAAIAADREANRLRCPDPTRRHLAEMRMMREVRRG